MRYITILIFILTLNIFSDTLYNFDDENDEARFNSLIKDISQYWKCCKYS